VHVARRPCSPSLGGTGFLQLWRRPVSVLSVYLVAFASMFYVAGFSRSRFRLPTPATVEGRFLLHRLQRVVSIERKEKDTEKEKEKDTRSHGEACACQLLNCTIATYE